MAGIVGQESDVHFGEVDKALPDWRKLPDEEDPDDELLEKTPEDVIRILGFDPLDLIGEYNTRVEEENKALNFENKENK